MLRLKSCPKCKGDVLLDQDQYGWYEQCIQCGYLSDLQKVVEVRRPPVKMKKKKLPKPYE